MTMVRRSTKTRPHVAKPFDRLRVSVGVLSRMIWTVHGGIDDS